MFSGALPVRMRQAQASSFLYLLTIDSSYERRRFATFLVIDGCFPKTLLPYY